MFHLVLHFLLGDERLNNASGEIVTVMETSLSSWINKRARIVGRKDLKSGLSIAVMHFQTTSLQVFFFLLISVCLDRYESLHA